MRSRRRDRNSLTPSSISLQIRETVERLIPDSLPRARTRSPGLAGGHPLDPRLADHGASGPCPPACAGGAGRGRTTSCAARGSRARPPRRWWPRSWASCRCACWCAPACARGAARRSRRRPRRRPGPCGPARGQTAEDARLARSGSARTSRISADTAHWFVAGIVGALLVNPGRRTWAPTMPPPVPTTPGGSPAGIATTLRDAPRPQRAIDLITRPTT